MFRKDNRYEELRIFADNGGWVLAYWPRYATLPRFWSEEMGMLTSRQFVTKFDSEAAAALELLRIQTLNS